MKKETTHKADKKGFTLIELLIVIGIIGFLAAAVLVAVDPVKRIQDSRNAQRWSEVNAVLNAILKHQVDERALFAGGDGAGGTGNLIISHATNAQLVIDNAESSTADVSTVDCTGEVDWATLCPGADDANLDINTSAGACMADLAGLVPTYLAEVPTDPNTTVTGTGYFIHRNPGNRITIGACEPEQGATISVRR